MFQVCYLGDMNRLFLPGCSQLISHNVFQQILLDFLLHIVIKILTGIFGL